MVNTRKLFKNQDSSNSHEMVAIGLVQSFSLEVQLSVIPNPDFRDQRMPMPSAPLAKAASKAASPAINQSTLLPGSRHRDRGVTFGPSISDKIMSLTMEDNN